MLRWILILSLCLILVPNMVLGNDYQYKTNLSYGDNQRFLGDQNLGNIKYQGLSLYITNPQTRSQLFGFEITDYNNDLDGSSGLVVPEHEFDLGINHQINQRFSLKLATSYARFLGDDPFFSYGLYPSYQYKNNNLEFGHEYDEDGVFYCLMSRINSGQSQLFSALSLEDFEERHGPTVEEAKHHRFGGALRYHLTKDWHLIGGGNYNTDLKKMSWIAGFSNSINFLNRGLNPGIVAIHRVKPDSRYSLAIFTLHGYALNQMVNQVIHEAFFRGSFKRSRIIGGRYMGDPGLGSAHEQVDFATFSVAFSSLSVNIDDNTELMHYDVTSYLSYPGNFGKINRPYIGLTWTRFSDLIYDFRTHSLYDPKQQLWEIKFGGKLKFHGLPDVRINLVVDNTGGIDIKNSVWF